MKIRDSGMPDEATWSGFFDPTLTLRLLRFPANNGDVVDFGCGYGTFSVAAAQLTSGIVHALDLDPRMISATVANAVRHDLINVRPLERDFVQHGTGLAEESIAYAMLFNILHAEDPLRLLREAFSHSAPRRHRGRDALGPRHADAARRCTRHSPASRAVSRMAACGGIRA
jgi:SAM-dependent methyltransferase